MDRRRIRKRIDRLKTDLEGIRQHRQLIRKEREKASLASAVLIGYTNAGKSTLINSLTYATQPVRDSMFTTLDPLTRSIKLPQAGRIVISDTVGFLHNLPLHLIEAFKATLEEIRQADILIHVLDASSSLVYKHSQAVFKILKELDAEKKPVITALNKIDLLNECAHLERLKKDFTNAVAISAKLKENLDALLKKIELQLKPDMVCFKSLLPSNRMDLVDLFYREGKVKGIQYSNRGIEVEVCLPKFLVNRLLKQKVLSGVKI
jgi:GTP-binding protein HflX